MYYLPSYPADFKYQQFGSELSAHFFNATWWAELVAAAGAKYFVLTSKHHDGFANWPSSRNFGWNSRDIGQKRDVVGELAGSTFFKNLPSFDLICAVKLSENHSKKLSLNHHATHECKFKVNSVRMSVRLEMRNRSVKCQHYYFRCIQS